MPLASEASCWPSGVSRDVPMLYFCHKSVAGSVCGVRRDCLSSSRSKAACCLAFLTALRWDAEGGVELCARLCPRAPGVALGLDERGDLLALHPSCSCGEAMVFRRDDRVSSLSPNRSARGSLVAGVDGGGFEGVSGCDRDPFWLFGC